MGFFTSKSKDWPPTPYGYQPPADADVRSWACADPECDTGAHAPDRRTWPKACPTCGRQVVSGVVSGRYERAAERFELDYNLASPRTPEWKRQWSRKRDLVWRYIDESQHGRLAGVQRVRAEVEAFLTEADEEFDTEARSLMLHAASAYHLPGEVLANLQRWFQVVPRDDLQRGDRHSSVRTLIDGAISFLEDPQVPKDADYQQVWRQLRELAGQASEYTTADNNIGMRRLLHRLG